MFRSGGEQENYTFKSEDNADPFQAQIGVD